MFKMAKKTIKKYFVALVCAAYLLIPVSAQDFSEGQEQELTPEELLELENEESGTDHKKDKLPQELQQNFIIVEPVRVHELNPQVKLFK